MNPIRRKAVPRYAALSVSILAVLATQQAAQAACVLRTDLTPQTWICDGAASANTSGQTIVFSPTVSTASTAAGFGVDTGNSGTALTINGPGMEQQQLQELVDKAHIVCPYSNATRNNIDVRLKVTT